MKEFPASPVFLRAEQIFFCKNADAARLYLIFVIFLLIFFYCHSRLVLTYPVKIGDRLRKKGNLMIRTRSFWIGMVILLSLSAGLPAAESAEPAAGRSVENNLEKTPPRLLRRDCFFGVHFDFHAEEADKNIGQNTTPEMVNALIDLVHPDFFEVDTKGHPGYSSYPTKVGNHGESFVGDPLRVWREVTAERGVSLFAHYSSLWDQRAFTLHPDWAAVGADGKPVAEKLSIFSPYVDSLLIPQLAELGKDYGLDGAWVDGDCWCFVPDYCDTARKAFTEETGIETIPAGPDDPNWHVWRNFQRELFRRYVERYTAAVKKAAPGFQICSNGAFNVQMPEAPLPGIDFASLDMNSVNVCRYNSRLFATQDIPWDLMSWSFSVWSLRTLDPPESRKTAVQLQREAACAIAQGGGYQAVFSQAPAGYPPVRDGSVDLEKVRLFGEVADFCRARQEVCFKAKPIPQIGLLLSTEGTYRRWDEANTNLFWGDRHQDGIMICILEDRQAVSVLVTEKMMKRADEFPLIIVFQPGFVEPEMVERLGEYVEKGGRLYLVGSTMPTLFDKWLRRASNVLEGKAPEGRTLRYYLVGRGIIGMTPQENPPVEFVNEAVHALFPNPMVQIEGKPQVDLSLMKTVRGETAVHLVNISGPHASAGVIDKIDPVGPVTMTIRLPKKPKRISLAPGNRPVNWNYADGMVRLTVESVPIHEIVVIEEE